MKNIFCFLITTLFGFALNAHADPSGITAGNGKEYQVFLCGECESQGASLNPKMSTEMERDADEMREKVVALREKGDLDAADKLALEGIKKGYILFYNEMADNAEERENPQGEPRIPFRDSRKKEWLIKGAENGSNDSVEGLFRYFVISFNHYGNLRSDLLEAHFWGEVGIASSLLYDDDADWLSINKKITPEEKSATTTRANEWMKKHNWPAITQ